MATQTNAPDARTEWKARYAKATAHLDSIQKLMAAEARVLEKHEVDWGHVGDIGEVVGLLRELEATILGVEPRDLE